MPTPILSNDGPPDTATAVRLVAVWISLPRLSDSIHVTASFVKEAGIDITRPPAATAERKERGNILVAITENDQIWIDRRQVDARALRANIERLHAENPDRALLEARTTCVAGDTGKTTTTKST